MIIILLFAILGFFAGLTYVMAERKIRPSKLLAAAFLGYWLPFFLKFQKFPLLSQKGKNKPCCF